MEKTFLAVYELFKLRCADGNILNAYYPFLADIIAEKGLDQISESFIKKEFEAKYGIPITIPFIRQVLGVGLENGSIVKKYGEYIADICKLREYKLPDNDFDALWKRMRDEFGKYCDQKDIQRVSDEKFEELVFALIDTYNIKFIVDNEWSGDVSVAELDYNWYKFIRELPVRDERLFDFLAFLSASNTYREALFVSKKEEVSFGNINIYLDSPMVFAVLGMDSEERCLEYRELVKKMQDAGCDVLILDNNFEEVAGIIERAGLWANSIEYDISKANKVAKYFHDSGMTRADVIEYSEMLESRLNDLGIVVKQTTYDTLQNAFQEDEMQLFEMVKEKYSENGMALSLEKERSIQCDVKSVIMVYRERRGRTATKIQTCAELMLTRNAALANVCKQYEKKRSGGSGHIPACISGDLFGAVLWLNSPMESVEYQKKKILADCYSALQPNKELLNRYIDSLESALKNGGIDEKKYLLLRSHTVVADALMNVTNGDYARFNDRTYIEVYEEIKSIASKDFAEEKMAHDSTKKELDAAIKNGIELKDELEQTKKDFEEYKAEQIKKEEENFAKKCLFWGNCIAHILCIVPYFVIYIVFEYVKAKVTNEVTARNIIILAIVAITSAIIIVVRNHLIRWCTNAVSKVLKNRILI